jgi:hypothetical protein
VLHHSSPRFVRHPPPSLPAVPTTAAISYRQSNVGT